MADQPTFRARAEYEPGEPVQVLHKFDGTWHDGYAYVGTVHEQIEASRTSGDFADLTFVADSASVRPAIARWISF